MEDQDKVVVRSEDEIKESIITEYGFDETEDAERIEKLVNKELDHDKKLSSAIGAKIKHRTEAEELKKKLPPEVTPPVEKKEDGNALSQKDILAVAKADIHEDDLDEVLEYARFKKIPVSEALKSDVIKTTLATKAEQRNIAENTHTGNARRSSAKVSDEVLLNNASSGKVPESEDEINRLIELKNKGK